MSAWQTANLQGAKPDVLHKLLDSLDGREAQPARASTDELMTVMAQWRVAKDIELGLAEKAKRPGLAATASLGGDDR